MHKVFGKKEKGVSYATRKGAYLIPVRNGLIGVVKIPKGIFLLGGGIDEGETDEACIARECLEEVGCGVSIKAKIGSAETFTVHSELGYFHPVQTYYLGDLSAPLQSPTECDHTLIWEPYQKLKGTLFAEMQNWALDQAITLYNQAK